MSTSKKTLIVGQTYIVTAKFAKAADAMDLMGKGVVYRGLEYLGQPDSRDEESSDYYHLFEVVDSEQGLRCPTGVSAEELYYLLTPSSRNPI